MDMEICTKQGLSALVVAIKIGHLDETKLLVAGGADINRATEETGMTPLMTAALCVCLFVCLFARRGVG